MRGDSLGLQHFCWCALKDNFASLASSLRTDIYYPVGCKHHIAIMFYYDDGIADVAKFFQTVDEALVITLMQSDTWLVEDIEYIDQLTANLRSKSDALAFTTGKGSRLTVEREIIQTDIEKEGYAGT